MDEAGLDQTQIFAEVMNSFSPGYDTVSIALDYLMFNMALHPNYQVWTNHEYEYVHKNAN